MVIQIMVERLYPTGNLRYALDANFLYVAFAAAFLVNVGHVSYYCMINPADAPNHLVPATQIFTAAGRERAKEHRNTGKRAHQGFRIKECGSGWPTHSFPICSILVFTLEETQCISGHSDF